jgi:hypothetical protein
MTLEESIATFDQVVHPKTSRSALTYQAIESWAVHEITRNRHYYLTYSGELPYTKRLYRDGIDFALRRYHEYCIKQRIGHHYVQADLKEKGVFEHMVPLCTIRDMVIAGVIRPIQGCKMPMCRISKANDKLLREAGLASATPDIFNFWKRYNCIDAVFTTYQYTKVDKSMTLDDHFKLFA